MNPLLALFLSACVPARANPLHDAAASGSTIDILMMAEKDPEGFKKSVDELDEKGRTPLLIAARTGEKVTVYTLLSKGADPRKLGKGGRAPIHVAAAVRAADSVEQLLWAGAKGSDPDGGGCSPLYAMAEFADKKDPEPVVKLLLANGADPSAHCYEGLTPLHGAARQGDLAIVRSLVLHGAALDAVDDRGETPLFLAAQRGDKGIVAYLLEQGADPTVRAANVTPRMVAETASHPDVARILEKAERSFAPRAAAPAPARALVSDVDTPGPARPENPDDFAVVVGVEKYANGLPDAQFAERDAEAVRARLTALGVPARNVRFLSGSRATRASIGALVEDWLPRSVGAASRVFFYFSGHGSPDAATGQVFLVPYDGMPSLLDKTAYPVKSLYESLGKLKARQVVVALDACFSGMGGRSVLPAGARPLVTKAGVSVPAGSPILLFAAAGPGEITGAAPEQGHGLFTYYFLKGLGGEAADKSGAVTPLGLYEYLKPRVQNAAAKQDREQNPLLEGAVSGELVPAR
ncbi:MAG: ankyrin repeat domain-containing protein [Elusimicrobia bacterium]|nr:ankyrin repeat domain-containing protein [Elusimicrobiota bacterium]